VTARLTTWDTDTPDRSAIEAKFGDEGLTPHTWRNGPGDRYTAHSHGYHKVLYCLTGGIVFHTSDGDVELRPGDRLDVEPGTEHAATVGPTGVECMEASR
jgi:quercetin dioxygenase-like cupin family protein